MIKGYDGVSLIGAVGMGMCPLLAASALVSIGLGVVTPLWMWLSGVLLVTGGVIYALNYRCHRQIAPVMLFAAGGLLLWLGRYSSIGGTGWAGWSIWGSGGLLVLTAFVVNLRARRICVLKASRSTNNTL